MSDPDAASRNADSVEDAMKRALDLDAAPDVIITPPPPPAAGPVEVAVVVPPASATPAAPPAAPAAMIIESEAPPARPTGLPRANWGGPASRDEPAAPPAAIVTPPPPPPSAPAARPAAVAAPAADPEPAIPVEPTVTSVPPPETARPEPARDIRPQNWSTAPVERVEQPRRFPVRASAPPMINRVYDHIVEAPDDVIGFIAYALYKQDKRDWMVTWNERHSAEPTEDQVEAFVNAQMTVAQRDRYRSAARQILDAYALVAVDSERVLITRDAVAGRVEAAAEKVEEAVAKSRRFWRQFFLVLIGGIIAAGLVIGVVAILVAAGIDVAGYLGFEQAAAPDVVP
ncbi:MAG: hypothetical protein AB7O56_14990 [Bauldia sp.]